MARVRHRTPSDRAARNSSARVTRPLERRRAPRQARAKETVDALLEATARLLVKEGLDRASTNRIAEAAGVSIGSLYQYFPDKAALIAALVHRHRSEMVEVVRSHLADIVGVPIERATRALVEALIEAHRVNPALHRVLVDQAIRTRGSRSPASFEGQMEAIIVSALQARREEITTSNLEVAAFVLVNAAESSCHHAVLDRPDLLEGGVLVDELTALIVRYLTRSDP